MSGCLDTAAGQGVIRSVLGTVDCHAQVYSKAGYLALTGPGSWFPTALTVLLTIYVAVLGLRLILGAGSARLGDAPMIGLKIGFVLTLTLNWTAFQTLVFDLAMQAPIEVARAVARPAAESGSTLAASPLDGLQAAYDQITQDAEAYGKAAGPNPQVLQGGAAATAAELWKARDALFMSTAGLLAVTAIATGVLAAVGPVFIALFLFEATRGLFMGWVRALLASALAPMCVWISTAIMLVVIEPALGTLGQAREHGALDPDAGTVLTAMIYIFAVAQGALAIGASVIAGGLQLPIPQPARGLRTDARASAARGPDLTRAERLAEQLQVSAALRGASGQAADSVRTRVQATASSVRLDGRQAPVRPGAAAPIASGDPRRSGRFDRLSRGRRA